MIQPRHSIVIFLALTALAAGAVRHLPRRDYRAESLRLAADSAFVMAIDTAGCRSIEVEVRAHAENAAIKAKSAKGRWELSLDNGLCVGVTTTPTDFGLEDGKTLVGLSISHGGTLISETILPDNTLLRNDDSVDIAVSVTNDGQVCVTGGGDTPLFTAFSGKIAGLRLPMEARVVGRNRLGLDMAVVEKVEMAPLHAEGRVYDVYELTRQLAASTDPNEGVWEYLDRIGDTDVARLGGRYKLATARVGDGVYDIVYLGGAEVLVSDWQPGMIKGRLTSKPFIGLFDLEWIDADMQQHALDQHGQITSDGSLLQLEFPLRGDTQIRFNKVRK